MIVVSILGILAAIVYPEFQGHVQQAKEAQAKANLKLLREAIEIATSELTEINYKTPNNPFNNKDTINPVFGEFPAEATGQYGYLYRGKQIRLDWPGTDSQGIRYYDY